MSIFVITNTCACAQSLKNRIISCVVLDKCISCPPECSRFPEYGSRYSSTAHFRKVLVDSNHNRIYIGAR